MTRTNSRGVVPSKLMDSKRLSTELSVPTTVPLLTPSSAVQSVPPSPLKAEFTSTPPLVVKPLPVSHAARALQFDQDQSEDRPMKHLAKFNQSRVDTIKQVGKADHPEAKPDETKSDVNKPSNLSTQCSKTPSRSSSVTFLEDSIKYSSKDAEDSTKQTENDSADKHSVESKGQRNTIPNASGQSIGKGRTMSDASTSSQVDTVSIDNISQVIDSLESHDGIFLLSNCKF